jgi:hypothetical protein
MDGWMKKEECRGVRIDSWPACPCAPSDLSRVGQRESAEEVKANRKSHGVVTLEASLCLGTRLVILLLASGKNNSTAALSLQAGADAGERWDRQAERWDT